MYLCASALLAGFCVTACGPHIVGSGNVVTQSRDVLGFHAVELAGDGRLYIEANGKEGLTITADDNLMEHLRSKVSGSRLILETENHVDLDPSAEIVYRLSVKSLDEINVSGDATVDAKGIQTQKLRIRLSGDGSVLVAGTADEQDVRISGDGDYRGQDLSSKSARVDISGDGNAVVVVSDSLDANLSGDGSLEYIGNPRVTQHVSGDGSIRQRKVEAGK
jgi:hypothetical protein